MKYLGQDDWIMNLFMFIAAMAIMGTLTFFFINISDDIEEKKELIGKVLIISNDTVVITSYDSWGGCYRLSNGTTIDVKLANILKCRAK